MAISASKSKVIYASASSTYGYTLYVKFTETATSIANNTSSISISGYMEGNNISWSSNYNSYLKLYWHDNNTNKDKLIATSSGFKSLTSRKSISGTTTVTHKSDGSLSGYAKLTYTAGSDSGGYAPASNNVSTSNTALTKIARASSISSVSGTYLGSSVTVSISRKSSNFTHKVEYSFAGSGYTTATSSATTSATFTPSLSLASNIPNSTSGTLTVRVTTYNGSTKVGSAVTSTKTLSLPASVVPTISSVSASRINNSVPSSWGVYVKGISGVTLAFGSVSGAYGSTIKSYSISGTGVSSSSTSTSYNPIGSSGTLTYTFKVTDSRGRTATKTTSISVVDYSVPSISVTASRCDSSGTVTGNGTYLRVTANYSISSVSGKNSVSSRSVSCNNVSNTTFTSGTAFTLAANCSIGSTYTLTASVTDALGKSASVTYDIPTASRIMNVKANKKGIAFGMFAQEDDTLASNWIIDAQKGYKIIDLMNDTSELSTNRSNTDPMSFRAFDYYNTTGSPSSYGLIFEMVGRQDHWQTQLAIGSDNNLYFRVKQYNTDSFGNWKRVLLNNGSGEALTLSNWIRTTGSTGWRNDTYGGGFYMTDSVWIRTYGGKSIYCSGTVGCSQVRADGVLNYIGTNRFTSQWFGFYDSATDAQNNTNRRGWIGYNSTKDLIIDNGYTNGYVYLRASSTSDPGGIHLQSNTSDIYFEGVGASSTPAFRPSGASTGDIYLGISSARWIRAYVTISENVSSDIRLKTNIQGYDERFEQLFFDLKPVRYELKKRMGQSHGGLIAQWVKEAMDDNDISEEEFGAYEYDSKNDEYGIVYSELISLNTHMIQKAYKKIDEQQKEIDDLKAQVQELKELVLAMSKKGE